jgi:hypothetical protein
MRRRAFVGVLLVATTGCYSYVPAQFDVIPAGEGVRVFLNQEGVARLRQTAQGVVPGLDGDQPVVQGTLTRRSAVDFSVLVPVTAHQEGFLQSELGQQITLPTADVVGVQQKKLSSTKTALALVGTTAGLAFVIVSIIQGARNPTTTDQGPPNTDVRIPLVAH